MNSRTRKFFVSVHHARASAGILTSLRYNLNYRFEVHLFIEIHVTRWFCSVEDPYVSNLFGAGIRIFEFFENYLH
jgi:hypothetical protein